jgi:hypothetical protein
MTQTKKHWFFQDIEISEIPYSKRTFIQKLRVIRLYTLMSILGGFAIIVLRKLRERSSQKEQLRNKLKHFKPTLHEGTWSNTISWEERDRPLTDEEVEIRL